jgi:hypothetical protein
MVVTALSDNFLSQSDQSLPVGISLLTEQACLGLAISVVGVTSRACHLTKLLVARPVAAGYDRHQRPCRHPLWLRLCGQWHVCILLPVLQPVRVSGHH